MSKHKIEQSCLEIEASGTGSIVIHQDAGTRYTSIRVLRTDLAELIEHLIELEGGDRKYVEREELQNVLECWANGSIAADVFELLDR